MGLNGSRPPDALRWFARLIVRGPQAGFVCADLDDGWVRDRLRGVSPCRAIGRYLVNMLCSAAVLAWDRLKGLEVGASWLDVKLGVRLLRRQPGLTAVAVFALALGIPAGLIPAHMVQAFRTTLPFEEGDRIVGVQIWDLEAARPRPIPLSDFEILRDELRSFQGLGASRSSRHNLVPAEGQAAPLRGAQVTASTFDILGVRPLLGRRLLVADEAPGAPNVLVLGYDAWQSRLGADPDVVGRTVRIGRKPYEVVGVMPRGFKFPVNDDLWTPFRYQALTQPDMGDLRVQVFGRLVRDVSLDQANAEAGTVGLRLASDDPGTLGHDRLEVVRFTALGQDTDITAQIGFVLMQLVALLLLGVACGNVGLLILARTAMRSSEMAVRTALGASRCRIVSQVFLEALVLSTVAAGVGLGLGQLAAGRIQSALGPDVLPFWLDFRITAQTAGLAMVLAVGSAVVAGVVPAIKATGGGIQSTLQRTGAGMGSSIRFGRFSSTLVVAEVTIAVFFLTMGGTVAPGVIGKSDAGLPIDPEAFLTATLHLPGIEPGPWAKRTPDGVREHLAGTEVELARRLSEEPEVGGVIFADALPGETAPGTWIEVDRPRASGIPERYWVRTAHILPDFFEELHRPVLAGRRFDQGDLATPPEERRAVIVNTVFVDQVLGGRNAIGQRIRMVGRGGSDPGPWREVVGVVEPIGMYPTAPERAAGFYQPMALGELHPVRVAVRTSGDPDLFASRLRTLASEVDPEAMIENPRTMSMVLDQQRFDSRIATLLFTLLASIAIVLSTAGLYALISFTVSQRTREIAVRTALGAHPGDIMKTVGLAALLQLFGGIVAGVVLSLLVGPRIFSGPGMAHVDWPMLVVGVAVTTLLVGLVSCLPPTLRGLNVGPAKALKEG